MHKVALVTSGEERLPAGTAEKIREFADFRAKRCETPAELLTNFADGNTALFPGFTDQLVICELEQVLIISDMF